MEIIILVAILQVVLSIAWYKIGFNECKEQKSNNSILYLYNGNPQCKVEREGDTIKIKVYDKKSVIIN